MKQLIIICSMLAMAGMANAQTSATGKANWDANDNAHTTAVKQGGEFTGTQMSFSDGKVTFSSLPQTAKATWAVVTNSAGDILKQTKVNPENNVVDLHNLHEGLYFVTLMNKNKSKKAFTLKV